MAHLYAEIASRVGAWRSADYPADDYPAISEILEWAVDEGTGSPRFLRRPQLQALETYWYLRLVGSTPTSSICTAPSSRHRPESQIYSSPSGSLTRHLKQRTST